MGISIPSGHWISSIGLKYTLETWWWFWWVAPNDVGTYVELVSELENGPHLRLPVQTVRLNLLQGPSLISMEQLQTFLVFKLPTRVHGSV